MTYDDIKSRKKLAFHPLFKRHIFRETTGGVKFDPCNLLFLKEHLVLCLLSDKYSQHEYQILGYYQD